MLRSNCGDRRFTLPPVELRRCDAVTPHQRAVAERRDDPAAANALQRRYIEMIVMIVADENEVDRRQIFEANAGWAVAAWTGEADR